MIVEALLDSSVTELVMSSEFARKQGFKLKKIKRLIYVRNVDSSFNKKGSIEYIMEINTYYQKNREKMEINVIGGQKWSVILEMLWLTCHNSEVRKIGVVKTKGRREKRGRRKETRREGVEERERKEEKAKKREDNRSE